MATPPSRVAIGAGGIVGSPNPFRQGAATVHPLATMPVDFQFAIMPMQAMPKWYNRRFDFGFGFQFYHENRHLASIMAPHVEGSYVLWQEALNPSYNDGTRFRPGRRGWSFGLSRVSITLQAQLPVTLTSSRHVGFGTTVRLTGEFLSFVYGVPKGKCGSGRGAFVCATGTAWGEISMGLFFEGTYMTIMGRHFGMIVAGLTFRIPASAVAGVAIAFPG